MKWESTYVDAEPDVPAVRPPGRLLHRQHHLLHPAAPGRGPKGVVGLKVAGEAVLVPKTILIGFLCANIPFLVLLESATLVRSGFSLPSRHPSSSRASCFPGKIFKGFKA